MIRDCYTGNDINTLNNYLNKWLKRPFKYSINNLRDIRSKYIKSFLDDFKNISIKPYNNKVEINNKFVYITELTNKVNPTIYDFVRYTIFDLYQPSYKYKELRNNGTHEFSKVKFEISLSYKFKRPIIKLTSNGEEITNDFETSIDTLYEEVNNTYTKYLKLIWLPHKNHTIKFINNVVSFDRNMNISYNCQLEIVRRIPNKAEHKYQVKFFTEYVMDLSKFRECSDNNIITNQHLMSNILDINRISDDNKIEGRLTDDECIKAKIIIKNFISHVR